MENKKLRWIKRAIKQFNVALDYIEGDSVKNAKKVADDIAKTTDKITRYPEFYSPDKYKIYNPNHKYRSFELHRYRITYRITKEEILITSMYHTSRKPRYY